MAQSTSSLPPQSAAFSLDQSQEKWHPEVTIETLISYLIAAKRSLTSIQNVHRANTVLSEARASVESTATLIAKTTYLRRSLLSQLKILRGIQFELEGAAHAIQIEFQQVVKELDGAERRLARNVHALQHTQIEDAFKRAQREDETPRSETPKNSLHDFVEDGPIEELKETMKDVIDNVQDAREDTSNSIRGFENDLQSINELLADRGAAESAEDSDLQRPNASRSLRSLEDHAHEMAEGLESLVKHFDLCVTAIKHTEGAGEAVLKTANAGGLPDGVDVENLEGPAQPMNEEERVEMLQVLQNDAEEVHSVVVEIQDHSGDMEVLLDRLVTWKEQCEASHTDISDAFSLLETLGAKLSNHVAESARQATRWAEDRAKIEDGIAGMEELCETYDSFLYAYDRLIVEAARRRTVKKQMERLVEDAHTKLEQLYESDLAEREHFRTEQGDYLPSDIWHGLHSLPPRFGFARVDGIEDDSIPELPRKTVEEALKRLKAGLKPS